MTEDFEWTPFMRGFVFWESPKLEYLPPADDAGRREWLAGFQQAYADYPDTLDPETEESPVETLSRLLAGHPALYTLKTMLRPGIVNLLKCRRNSPWIRGVREG